MNPDIRKYISKYLWRNLILASVLCLPLAALLCVFFTLEAADSPDAWWAITPLACGVLWLGYCLVRAHFFRRMIERQEKRFQTPFRDDGAVRLHDPEDCQMVPAIHVYLNDNWIVFPGKIAVCRKNICGLPSRRGEGRYSHIHILTIKTSEGRKYRQEFGSEQTIRKIRRWCYGKR